MENASRPGLTFQIYPGDRGVKVVLCVNVPGKLNGPLPYKGDLLSLAAVAVRLRIEAARNRMASVVTVDEEVFGEPLQLFHQAWNLLKNSICADKRIAIGQSLHLFPQALRAAQKDHKHFIQLDVQQLNHHNLVFDVRTRGNPGYVPIFERDLLRLFDFLTGKLTADELILRQSAAPAELTSFRFGKRDTGTTVVQRFPDGLAAEFITCSLTHQEYSVGANVEALISRAHEVLLKVAPGALYVKDSRMLAPVRFEVSRDLDDVRLDIAFSLSESSYPYYAAFAFAELLTKYSEEFLPLLEFTRKTPDARQPAPATCSIGVRVLLETTDRRLVVAHRSNDVKLNPDVWSVSANEGVRQALLRPGRDCKDLMLLAVIRALHHELRVEEQECQRPVLLSVYRNAFNQWGAGFIAKTDLTFAEVAARQPAADHSFEYVRLASLPLDIQDCGRAMRNLGERWYGGALESLCQFFAWHNVGSERFISPEDVAASLDAASGGVITPIDQANPAFIRTK